MLRTQNEFGLCGLFGIILLMTDGEKFQVAWKSTELYLTSCAF